MDAIGTELRVLTAAGDLITQPRLTLPERATALAPMTAHALARLASTPFALTVVHASARAPFLNAMAVLHEAATAQNRPVLWCDAAETATDDTAGAADHWTALAQTQHDLQAGWRPAPGTLLVVDHAADAPPEVIADLAEAAAAAQTRVILIDTEPGTRWPQPPSAPLLRLLQADLPWAVTLTTDHRPLTWLPSGPDLDPALVQAAALAPHLHTPDLAAAVAQRDALRTSLRTAHTIDSRLADIAARNRDQGNDGRTRQ